MSVTKTYLADMTQAKHMAAALAKNVAAGDCIALYGEVGSGKTTFAQGFIHALLAAPEAVTSPTFTLMQSYDTIRDFRVLHVDLYRLKHEGELNELGLDEALGSHVTLIEWPQIAQGLLPKDTLHIHIEYKDEQHRQFHFKSQAARWQEHMQHL